MKRALDELKAMERSKLESRAEELRKELLKLRLNQVTSPSKSFASVKQKLKREIAQALTVLRQKIDERGKV